VCPPIINHQLSRGDRIVLLYTADEEAGSVEEIDFENEEEEVDLLQLISLGHQQLLLDETPVGGGIGAKKTNSSLNNVSSKDIESA
jgi:hypothetical protein